MEYKLQISIRAQNDAIDAIDYYDNINPELGTRFITELSEIYEKLKANPQFYSFIFSNTVDKFRDVKLPSFPYVVIYEIYEPDVVITSVMSTYRKPFVSLIE